MDAANMAKQQGSPLPFTKQQGASLASGPSIYSTYHRDALKMPAHIDYINGWKIEYLAFASQTKPNAPPIIILGGAFQNFNSYKYCVEPLLEVGSVLLVDLPALGANDQIKNTETGQLSIDLALPEIAHLLGMWTEKHGLQTVSMMGMSLGSVVAATFAYEYPQKMARLVLMGVMQETRASWRMLIEESLNVLAENRMAAFGEAVILYLVNHAKLTQTKLSPTAKRLFCNQIAAFSPNEQQRYAINAARLLRLQKVPSPQCPTLVATGEFDSFTLPHENAQFALTCANATFALINNADHVPQLQRRRETLALFVAFLNESSINHIEGTRVLKTQQMQALERRAVPRVQLKQAQCQLLQQHKAVQHSVYVENICYFGVLLRVADEHTAAHILQQPQGFSLQLMDNEGAPLTLDCLLFESTGVYIRALFKHGGFENAARLNCLLESDSVLGARH